MAASYPTTIKSFPAKANGDYVLLTHVTDLEEEVVAIETALKTGPTALASASLSSATVSQAVFTNGSKQLVSNAITGSGNVVMSASPTLTGTIAAAAATFSTPLVVSSGGTGLATLTDKNVLIGAGTGTVAGVAPGSSGNVLTSDGTDWASSGAPSHTGNVAFPATQSASADANTLDDYEEFTWTPVLGGAGGTSGQTYIAQVGIGTKIGDQVHLSFAVLLNGKGTITGTASIQGLPFTTLTSGSGEYQGGTVSVGYQTLDTSYVAVNIIISGNVVSLALGGNTAAAITNNTALTTTNINNVTRMWGEFSYKTAT
jgi:hypothetical protein